jgi:hypothetical protein
MAFVGDKNALDGYQSIKLPFLPLNRRSEFIKEYSDSLGLGMTKHSPEIDASLLAKCFDPTDSESIWVAAASLEQQIAGFKFSHTTSAHANDSPTKLR